MKSKLAIMLLALVALAIFAACGGDSSSATTSSEASSSDSVVAVTTPDVLPNKTQIMNICELSTLKCYYHNVTKVLPPEDRSILPWVKYQHYWMEYGGVIDIGIDVSKVDISVNGTQVDITIPEAEILDYYLDEDKSEGESTVLAKDSAKVEAADKQEKLKEAKESMKLEAQNDTELFARAKERAETLLEDYVINLGKATGKTYTVTFHTIGKESETLSSEQSEAEK